MIRTFVDSGVLVAAATTRDPDLQPAAASLLDGAQREFVSSIFVRMDVLPKAISFRRAQEIAFSEEFFAGVVAWADPLDLVVRQAAAEGASAGLGLGDALHVAAAVLLGAEEFITTERPRSALLRVASIPVRSNAWSARAESGMVGSRPSPCTKWIARTASRSCS